MSSPAVCDLANSELALSRHLPFFHDHPVCPTLPRSEASSCPSQRLLSSSPAALTVCHPHGSWPSSPAEGHAGAQKQQGQGIPREPQRRFMQIKGAPGRTKLSQQLITEPALKITLGQWLASCESPGAPVVENTSLASWLLRPDLGDAGVCRVAHMSRHGAGRCQHSGAGGREENTLAFDCSA